MKLIIILLFIFLYCSKGKNQKFDQIEEIKKISVPTFLKDYNLMILPIEGNFLNSKELKILINLEKNSELLIGSGSKYTSKNVNYLWKDLNNIDGKMNHLFNKDIAIISKVSEINLNEQNTNFILPFSLIIGINDDTNKDNEINELDMISFYIFNYSTKKLFKISPDDVSINPSSYEILLNKNLSTLDKVNPDNYIIYFEEYNNSNKKYFYHIRKNYLEIVDIKLN